MFILSNNKMRIGYNRTVYKLIIISINGNKSKTKMRIKTQKQYSYYELLSITILAFYMQYAHGYSENSQSFLH